jgi:hypothetical protein
LHLLIPEAVFEGGHLRTEVFQIMEIISMEIISMEIITIMAISIISITMITIMGVEIIRNIMMVMAEITTVIGEMMIGGKLIKFLPN